MDRDVFILILAGVIVWLFIKLSKSKRGNKYPRYENYTRFETVEPEKKEYYSLDFDFSVFQRKRIFSNNEQDFFRSLEQLIDGKCYILSKVSLKELLKIDENIKYKDREAYYSAFNRVVKMHLDFILISKSKHYIECIIEVDDKSHDNESNRLRDRFKDEVIKTLDFPFVRIPALQTGAYTPEYIHEYLEQIPNLALKPRRTGQEEESTAFAR